MTFANFYQWLAIAYAITLVGSPALSLPCGFTRTGLPAAGDRPRNGEPSVLAGARLLEQILGLGVALPVTPKAAPRRW